MKDHHGEHFIIEETCTRRAARYVHNLRCFRVYIQTRKDASVAALFLPFQPFVGIAAAAGTLPLFFSTALCWLQTWPRERPLLARSCLACHSARLVKLPEDS